MEQSKFGGSCRERRHVHHSIILKQRNCLYCLSIQQILISSKENYKTDKHIFYKLSVAILVFILMCVCLSNASINDPFVRTFELNVIKWWWVIVAFWTIELFIFHTLKNKNMYISICFIISNVMRQFSYNLIYWRCLLDYALTYVLLMRRDMYI